MSTTSDKPKAAPKPAASDNGETYEDALKKGYWGTVPDETPNEDYTVEGVGA